MTRSKVFAHLGATALICAVASASLEAALKYTVHYETRTIKAAEAEDQILTSMGTAILETFAPGGSLDMTCTISDTGTRIEWSKALPGIPAGAVLLRLRNTNIVVLNPADKTYWRLRPLNLAGLPAALKAQVKPQPLEGTKDVAGIPTTGATIDVTIPVPEAILAGAVTGTPSELPLTGEVWTTDKFNKYLAQATAQLYGLTTIGLDIQPRNFVMRQILRGPTFGSKELESVVVRIAEEDAAADLFVIPEGYKEIPPPPIR